jgi:membrane protein
MAAKSGLSNVVFADTPPAVILQEAASFALRVAVFLRQSIRRFIADRCLTGASALSYATLVSLVPLTAVVLVIFSGFPAFSGARDHFLAVLLGNFVPAVGEEAAAWFKHVATTTAQTTAVGTIALVVTSILLLATIEEELHVIWRVTTPRDWTQRVLAYWMVLTLGPLLLGVGLSLSGYLDTLAQALGMKAVVVERATRAWFAAIPGLISFVLEATAFTLLYCLIPNCSVRLRDGVAGALTAAALLEGLKLAFALFVARISSYNAIYGALAGIPIALLWMYIFWAVVLFGAEIAAGLGQRWGDEGEAPRFGARHIGIAVTVAPIKEEGARKDDAATVTTDDGERPGSDLAGAQSPSIDRGKDGQER